MNSSRFSHGFSRTSSCPTPFSASTRRTLREKGHNGNWKSCHIARPHSAPSSIVHAAIADELLRGRPWLPVPRRRARWRWSEDNRSGQSLRSVVKFLERRGRNLQRFEYAGEQSAIRRPVPPNSCKSLPGIGLHEGQGGTDLRGRHFRFEDPRLALIDGVVHRLRIFRGMLARDSLRGGPALRIVGIAGAPRVASWVERSCAFTRAFISSAVVRESHGKRYGAAIVFASCKAAALGGLRSGARAEALIGRPSVAKAKATWTVFNLTSAIQDRARTNPTSPPVNSGYYRFG